ncbi:MAG: 2-C-methyl-D-erythritol 4-phosphate cytidylyltransferase [Planctomycetota bacterium]|nr:2-C-methyl-D-erythritol 4-phosphate cytidylyltransferase [Planctomycetota bacterium]MDI6787736.1 2-C-methyl-D-erythritol 4-phosphate cytidylyltransferase [Planctomycetota bacterium]
MIRDISVIIVAAGESKRLKSKVRKPYLLLKDRPVLRHSIDVFKSIPSVREIVVVINKKDTERAERIIRRVSCVVRRASGHRADISTLTPILLVIGGKTRSESVRNGLEQVSVLTGIVLIHDAARPFVNRADVIGLIKEVRRTGAAILAISVADTIKMTEERKNHKRKNPIIKNTVTPRESLWSAQTPQGFRKDIIAKAYQYRQDSATDDAFLVERLGVPVSIVPGSANNIKITTKADCNILTD